MYKILQFIPGLTTGGAEALVRDYSLYIDHNEFQITVLVSGYKKNTPNEKILADNGINVIYAGESLERGNVSIINKILRRIKLQHNINNIVKAERPDLIHVHLNLLKHIVFLPKEFENVPIIYTCHNPPETLFGESLERYAARKLLRDKRLTIVSLQKDLAHNICSYFDTKNVVTIENCIELSNYKDVKISKLEKRQNIGLSANDFVIGHTGRFVEQKNHSFLVEIFKEAVKLNENSKLLLIGDGPLKGQIMELVRNYNLENKVIVLSNRSDVNELLNVMDRFVFPSIFEGFGIAVLEAQAAGIPCLVSDCVSDEVCVSEQFAKLSLNDSAKCWAKQLYSEISTDDKKRIKDINMYDIKNVIHRLEKLYIHEIMKRRG